MQMLVDESARVSETDSVRTSRESSPRSRNWLSFSETDLSNESLHLASFGVPRRGFGEEKKRNNLDAILREKTRDPKYPRNSFGSWETFFFRGPEKFSRDR